MRLAQLFIAAIACTATSAYAQKMYRCNNTYQDHPCSGGQESKVVGNDTGRVSAQASLASPKISRACSQRGVAAQKIKWVREAGQTQQQQEAVATGSAERDLIADVYNRQGTSGQVRAAIETDCMENEDREARAAALVEAANTLKGGAHSTEVRSATSIQNSVTSAPNASTLPRSDTGSSSQELVCQRLKDQLNEVSASQRAGANASRMEVLRQQHQEITRKRRLAGC